MRSITRSGAGDHRIGLRRHRVVPLTHENGRQLRTERRLHRRQKIGLVVDHNIVLGRIAPLHMIEHFFLVHIDHDAALDGIPNARALDLARLKHDVAVGQHNRLNRACASERSPRVRAETSGSQRGIRAGTRDMPSNCGSSSSPARNSCRLPGNRRAQVPRAAAQKYPSNARAAQRRSNSQADRPDRP